MSIFRKVSPVAPDLLSHLTKIHKTSLLESSPILQEAYKRGLQRSCNNESRLPEYVFWYLYNLCRECKFLKLSVMVNGKVQFHFGADLPNPEENKRIVKTALYQKLNEKHLTFLTQKRTDLNCCLQIEAVIFKEMEEIIAPIWEKNILPFIQEYFLFSYHSKANQNLHCKSLTNCLEYAEAAIRAKLNEIIQNGEAARILHIKLLSLKDMFTHLKLHESQEKLISISDTIRSFTYSLELMLSLNHSSHLIIGLEPNLRKKEENLKKEIAVICRKTNIAYKIYEKNIYDLNTDMAVMHRELRL